MLCFKVSSSTLFSIKRENVTIFNETTPVSYFSNKSINFIAKIDYVFIFFPCIFKLRAINFLNISTK